MRKKILIITSLILAVGCTMLIILAVYGNKGKFEPVAEEIHIDLPDIEKPFKILWLSDLHIATTGSDITKPYIKDVKARDEFSQHSADKWKKYWPDFINESGADLVVFGGDMVDFGSRDNLFVFLEGLNKLTIPYIYLRCDHDIMPTYISEESSQIAMEFMPNLGDDSDLISYEFENFVVVGWNNSAYNMTENGLEKLRNICAEGKPILFMTHVPIEPTTDTSLSERSREIFDGRSLLWGYNDEYYWPEYETRQLLDILYADDSPVVEVFCGHLHFSWDGNLTDRVKQHVFAPALDGSYGIITVE